MSEESAIDVPVLRNDEDTLRDRMTDNAYEQILPARYLKKNEDGEVIEEQEELFERVAKNIAIPEALHHENAPEVLGIEHTHEHFDIDEFEEYLTEDGYLEFREETARYISYDNVFEHLNREYPKVADVMRQRKNEFQDMMEYLKLMPNTPCLINAGRELQQLSACFVLDIDDDMRDIHEVAADAAEIFQSGGGLGYPFSFLRPYGDKVGSTGGVASGPISFMNTLDQVCNTVAQGGVRRGAQMGVMNISHPDIPFFIHAKNTDVSLAQTLLLNDPDDFTHNSFAGALEEAKELIDDEGRVPEHLRNAAEGHLSNFNISVAVTDEFMDALQNGENYTLINPRTQEPHIATEETKELYSWFDMQEYVEVGEPLSVPAQELWDRIVDGAHSNGEPGVIFIDRVNKHNTFDHKEYPEYKINATNPCGEEPLFDGDACNLTHINLSTIVNDDITPWVGFNEDGGSIESFLAQAIDWEEFNRRIDTGVNFLDNVVTMSDFPIDNIDETVQSSRKIGLGIMGLAQLFIQLGVEYGSEDSQEIARSLMKHIHHRSKEKSNSLALERGSFNDWDKSKWSDPQSHPEFFEKHTGLEPHNWNDGYPQRNHETTTIAPTGTTSQIGDTSGGCEPIFSVCYFKNVTDDIQGDDMLVEFDSLFLKTLEENGVDVEKAKEEAVELMNSNDFDGPASIPSVPEELGSLFVTTNQLSAKEHASVQCALQEGVGSGISKTVNAPNDSTLGDAKEAFEYIYENGGKSVTYYRDGSRTKQVQTTRRDNQEVDDGSSTDKEREVPFHREAPDVLDDVERHRIRTGSGKLYVTIGEDEHGVVEVMATVGKSGGETEAFTEALARQISQSLQWGVPAEEVIDQLQNIKGPDIGYDGQDIVHSVPDGIALALNRYTEDKEMLDHPTTKADVSTDNEQSTDASECPECGAMALVQQEGCSTCLPEKGGCGYSKCS